MISRFNLDQKRLNFYEDIEKFNKEFDSIISMTNKEEFDYLEHHEVNECLSLYTEMIAEKFGGSIVNAD